MANKNQEYTEQYADYAMEQMRRYGIPASVTLAQGILESSNGQSRLAQNENNHFGIKATPEWIAEGGRYSLYSDDKPNEKFCSYDSVGDSYEHHSRFLKENSRYARCFSLSPDDYKGWTLGLEKAGYATGGHYADSLQRIIEQNGLQKYDRQVMQEMEAQGKRFGVEENPLREAGNAVDYSFPVERKQLVLWQVWMTRQASELLSPILSLVRDSRMISWTQLYRSLTMTEQLSQGRVQSCLPYSKPRIVPPP